MGETQNQPFQLCPTEATGSILARGREGKMEFLVYNWSLTSLQQWLVKTGRRLVKHARYYWLLLAESHLAKRLFGSMLRRIAEAVGAGKSIQSHQGRRGVWQNLMGRPRAAVFGTRVGEDRTLPEPLGPAKGNNSTLESLEGCIVWVGRYNENSGSIDRGALSTRFSVTSSTFTPPPTKRREVKASSQESWIPAAFMKEFIGHHICRATDHIVFLYLGGYR